MTSVLLFCVIVMTCDCNCHTCGLLYFLFWSAYKVYATVNHHSLTVCCGTHTYCTLSRLQLRTARQFFHMVAAAGWLQTSLSNPRQGSISSAPMSGPNGNAVLNNTSQLQGWTKRQTLGKSVRCSTA